MKKVSFIIILIGLIAIGLKSKANWKINIENMALADSLQKKITDPVCKMNIKPTGAKIIVYSKLTYYFCSESCKQKFIAEPAKYIKK